MITDNEYNREMERMESEEQEFLDFLLELALMEEPYEEANRFRVMLSRLRTRGQLRQAIESKVRQHGLLPEESDPTDAQFCWAE